jgi:drug/metabolite transporter (DMT)-like permease
MDSLSERRKAVSFSCAPPSCGAPAECWSRSWIGGPSPSWLDAVYSQVSSFSFTCRIPRRFNRWQLLAAGAFILTQFLFITSTKLTTAANSIFLQYTAPIYVMLLAYWFLGEKPSRTDWLAMVVIFIGLTLFFGDKLSPEGSTATCLPSSAA